MAGNTSRQIISLFLTYLALRRCVPHFTLLEGMLAIQLMVHLRTYDEKRAMREKDGRKEQNLKNGVHQHQNQLIR